jgi:hypothetical protein
VRIWVFNVLIAGAAVSAVLTGCSGGNGAAGTADSRNGRAPTSGRSPTGFAADTVVPTGGPPGTTELYPAFTCDVLAHEWPKVQPAYQQTTGANPAAGVLAVATVNSFYADLAYELAKSALLSDTTEAAQDEQLDGLITYISNDISAIVHDLEANDTTDATAMYSGKLQTDEKAIATACDF